ncbi:hypothetical protein KKG41_04380 [Patescibacteria group bacterium]|nr:hypothetical protein [Patescibacteria group bacterium]MBU1890790.1 hypothetical protein [Patescibacteria group bacterium]
MPKRVRHDNGVEFDGYTETIMTFVSTWFGMTVLLKTKSKDFISLTFVIF